VVFLPEIGTRNDRSLSYLHLSKLELVLHHLFLILELLCLHLLLEHQGPFLRGKALCLSFSLSLQLHLLAFGCKVRYLEVIRTLRKVDKLRLITDRLKLTVNSGPFA